MIPYTAIRLEWQSEGKKQSAAVYDVSVYSLVLRVSEKIRDISQITVVIFYDNAYQRIDIVDYKLSDATPYSFYYEYKLSIDDENYHKKILQFMKQMDDYISYKNEDEQERSIAYPLEDDGTFYLSYDQMLKEMMTPIHPDVNYQKWFNRLSLAITLNDPHHYEMFLDHDWETFKNRYFKEYHLEDHVISKHAIDALYIGNAYCFLLFPDHDQLCQMIQKAQDLNLSVLMTLPPLKQRYIHDYEEIVRIAEKEEIEIIINDYGLLKHVQSRSLKYSLGILMNKYLKDPRLKYKPGNKAYVKATGISKAHKLLKKEGMMVISTETLTMSYLHDVYFPLTLTNMSSFCTMYARCHNGNRGRQEDVMNCPRYCLHQHFLYPKHMHLIGKYNALFAYNLNLLCHRSDDKNIRRLVFTC